MTLYRLDEWARALDPAIDAATLGAARAGYALICVGPAAPSFAQLAERSLALAAADQSEVLFDRFGRVAAYVSYAWLDAGAERHLLRHGVTSALAAAPRSGERLWLLDFAAFDGAVRAVLATLQGQVFAAADCAGYFRYKGGRRIGKMVGRAEIGARCGDGAAPTEPAARAQAAFPNYAHGAHALLDMAILLGQCMALAHAGGQFAGLSAAQVQRRLWTPLSLQQYRLYRDADGHPTGLVTWAWLDNAALARRADDPLHELAPETWNAGTVRCVADVLASAAQADVIDADYAGTLRYHAGADRPHQEAA